MIQLQALTKAFGERVLLDEVTWQVTSGDRVGLAGPNGAGKTTLLRMLASLDQPDRGLPALYQHLDVTQDADWKAAVATAEEQFGRLDILVNNAGILGMPSILEETEEHWNQVLAVNQTGVFLGIFR